MINIKEIKEITKTKRKNIKAETIERIEELIIKRARIGELSLEFDLTKTQSECMEDYLAELEENGFEVTKNFRGICGNTLIEWY